MSSDSLLLEERKYLRDLLRRQDDGSEAVVLVGSWARGTYVSPLSDIDVLLVGGSVPREAPPGVQLLRVSLNELRARVASGDDFLQWALRYGMALKGRRRWEKLREELLQRALWPEPDVKVRQAARRYRVAKALFDMGDLDAAQEEARFALSHLARAQLLSQHVFPLSRPELPDQLRALGHRELADGLERSNSPVDLPTSELEELLSLIARRLEAHGDSTSGRSPADG
jgi:predicted nucleotidyltransferase